MTGTDGLVFLFDGADGDEDATLGSSDGFVTNWKRLIVVAKLERWRAGASFEADRGR